MNILFIHQNFPGQFKYLAPALVQQGHTVVAMPVTLQPTPQPSVWNGVQVVPYPVLRGTSANIHPWVGDFESKVIRGQACFEAALQLKASGFTPQVIVAHHDWGESLFLKEVWSQARLGIYCEFHHQPGGINAGFDAEFANADPVDACRIRLKNTNNLLHFETADAGLSPTHWQASTFPEAFRRRITVIHDGMDTQAVVPNPAVSLTLNGTLALTRKDEVITFVNRNLEPCRGYHIFMRALPEIFKRRPNARVLIVGGQRRELRCTPTRRPDVERHFCK